MKLGLQFALIVGCFYQVSAGWIWIHGEFLYQLVCIFCWKRNTYLYYLCCLFMMSELATALAAQYKRLKSLTDCVALLLTIFYAASMHWALKFIQQIKI